MSDETHINIGSTLDSTPEEAGIHEECQHAARHRVCELQKVRQAVIDSAKQLCRVVDVGADPDEVVLALRVLMAACAGLPEGVIVPDERDSWFIKRFGEEYKERERLIAIGRERAERVLERIHQMADDGEELITMDGYDDCIIGVCYQCGKPAAVAYCYESVIAKLMNDGMDYDEAVEFFEFNQLGSYVGERTPVFIDRIGTI